MPRDTNCQRRAATEHMHPSQQGCTLVISRGCLFAPHVGNRTSVKESDRDLVHKYSYCVDRRLYTEVVELFTDDCVVDYAPGIAPVRSRAGLRAMFEHPGASFAATSHHNANVLVTRRR